MMCTHGCIFSYFIDVAVIISVTVICGVGIISMVVITLTLCLVYIRYIYKHRATDNSEMDHDQPQGILKH